MPYSSILDLPEAVKKLPTNGQEIFLATFNSAYKQYNSEEKAFAVAWSAVEKSYEKVDGKWQAIKNTEYIFLTNSELGATTIHDTILQTLNRKLGEYFYHADAFDETAWEGIPIVYQKEGIHPDLTKFLTNPSEELKRINARIVGNVTNPRKEVNGHSRLKGKFAIDDGSISELINSKKLSLSTAFFGKAGADKILTSTTPNHVLVFEEGAKGAHPPVDIGAIILNTETDIANKEYSKEEMDTMLDFMKENPGMMDKGTMDKMYSAMDKANQKEYTKSMLKELQSHPEMMDDEMKSMMKDMKKELKNTMSKEDELANQLAISNTEKETLKGELAIKNTELETAKAQLKVFEQKETERIKATTESRWQTIVNSLPKGIKDDAGKVAKLRTEFETDSQGFTLTMLEIKNTEARIIANLPGEDGKAIVNAEQDAKTKLGFTVGGTYTIGV